MIVKHYDIKTEYLNGNLSHEVYMKQPEEYQVNAEHLVCKLVKNLYGLKQGANEWYKKFNTIYPPTVTTKVNMTHVCILNK